MTAKKTVKTQITMDNIAQHNVNEITTPTPVLCKNISEIDSQKFNRSSFLWPIIVGQGVIGAI